MSTINNEYQKIYYQLCDGQNNLGGVDRIRLTSEGDVGDLRDVIYNRNPNRLGYIDTRDLRLYEWGTTVEDYKSNQDMQFLKISLPLSDSRVLSATEEKPLLVVVPSAALPTQNTANDYVASIQQEPERSVLLEAFKGLSIQVHGLREMLPSVVVGHVVSPSQASKNPGVVATVFDALGLELISHNDGSTYRLPDTCGKEWNFSWQWPRGTTDNMILERLSYSPVCSYLQKLSLFGEDVSNGQNCVEGLLFNSDIFTRRLENPFVSGQKVYHRHRVAGRTDIAVLEGARRGPILRHMVKFVIELKTVEGYRQSTTGCLREAQLQLIGLNAFNTTSSPPVLLSNLATTHQVVYLAKDEDWKYDIVVQDCDSFAAAVHFAKLKSEETGISQHFARPNTPAESDSSTYLLS